MTQEACVSLPDGVVSLSSQQTQIRSFVLHFCQAFGLKVNQESDGSLLIHCGTELAETVGVAPTQRICFAPEQVDAHTEYVTLGHPLLDRLLALAKTRGKTTSVLFTFSLDPTFLQLTISYDPTQTPPCDAPIACRRLWTTMGRLRFTNAKSRIVKARALNQLQVLFYFRVSFISDERQELLVPILIDPTTEAPTYLVGLEDAVSFVAPVHVRATRPEYPLHSENEVASDAPVGLAELLKSGQDVLPKDPYTLLRLYRTATEHLECELASDYAAFAAEAKLRLERERLRIEEYYAGLTQEMLEPLRRVFRRMASLSVRRQLTHSFQAQLKYTDQMVTMKQEANELEAQYTKDLEQLAKEKALRMRELDMKYQCRVVLHLVSVAAVHVPRLEYTFRIAGKQRREITILYDVLRDQIMDFACDACNRALENVVLCSCGDLVCPHCSDVCACGEVVCADCHHTVCHVCGVFLCASCATSCPISQVSRMEIPVCAACRQEYCAECRAMVGDTLGLGY